MSKAIYLGAFDSNQPYPLINNKRYYDGFDVSDELVKEIKSLDIIVGVYEADMCGGQAFCLYKKDGKLYEVNDSHCSCDGLNQWIPEETTKEALLKRSFYGFGEYKDKLLEIINTLEEKL